jgi:hypothetical protein
MMIVTLRKSGLPAVVVGERAVVHHLQQDVVDVGVRLLDLVHQQHAVRMLGDRLRQLPALVEADVARRRADQPRHRVALHVLRHVEAYELDAETVGELPRDLGLADAGGPLNRKLPIGFCGLPRPERAIRIAATSASIAWSWPNTDVLQVAIERLQRVAVVRRDVLRRDRARSSRRSPRSRLADHLLLLRLRQDLLRGARLVDHVDRLVWQMPIVDEARGELRSRRERGRART